MNPIAQQALEQARLRSGVASESIAPLRRRKWSVTDISTLSRLYPDTSTKQIAEQLGRPMAAVYGKADLLGLKKSQAFLDSPASGRLEGERGTATRFQPGGTSWNKGVRFVAGGRSAETRFDKGDMPHNHVPVGTEVMGTDGYLKMKVAEPRKWEWTHRRNWEEVHGPIAKGLALVFKDRNRLNCDVSNLELLTRSQLMLRNTIHRYPPELKETIRQLSKFNKTLEAAREKQND